jgi:hypothetical protein
MIFNIIGIIEMVCGVLVALFLKEAFPSVSKPFAEAGGGIIMILSDFFYRLNRDEEQAISLVLPWRGGHVFFIPIWLVGFVMIGQAFFRA